MVKRQGSKPNCTKGYSCGATCINTKKACRNPVGGQSKDYAGWLKKQVDSGNLDSLSAVHKANAKGNSSSVKTKKTDRETLESLGLKGAELQSRLSQINKLGDSETDQAIKRALLWSGKVDPNIESDTQRGAGIDRLDGKRTYVQEIEKLSPEMIASVLAPAQAKGISGTPLAKAEAALLADAYVKANDDQKRALADEWTGTNGKSLQLASEEVIEVAQRMIDERPMSDREKEDQRLNEEFLRRKANGEFESKPSGDDEDDDFDLDDIL